VPQFEKESGHKVTISFYPAATLVLKVKDGAPADIVMTTPDNITELTKTEHLVAGTQVDFVHSRVGVAVKEGAPKPDISTPESLKRALLAAKAVGHSKEGQSGIAFVEALKRLGIEAGMRPKIRTYELRDQAIALQNGEIDIAASGMGPMIEMPGAELLGGLPPGLQSYVRFSIGVSTESNAPGAARELQRFLVSPAVLPVFKAKGLERD